MPRERAPLPVPPGAESAGHRMRRLARAAGTLLRLELKVVSGNRTYVLVATALTYFVIVALFALFSDDPYETAWFYNGSVLLPSLMPAIALGMAAVLGDRDSKQLEVTFVSPGGRFQVWAFRFAAIFGTCLATALGLAILTAAILDHEFRWLAATLHAAPPLGAILGLTVFIAVLTRNTGLAGLLATVATALAGVVLHPAGPSRWNLLFLNPFVPPEDLIDPLAWVRILFWNRVFLCVFAALCFGATLWLLQRRERLL